MVFFAGSAGNQRVKYIESKSAFSTICVSYVLSRVLVGDPRRLLKMRFLNVFFLRRICFVSSHLHELHRREPAAVEPPRLEHHPALARRQLPQLLLVQHWNFHIRNQDNCQKNMLKTFILTWVVVELVWRVASRDPLPGLLGLLGLSLPPPPPTLPKKRRKVYKGNEAKYFYTLTSAPSPASPPSSSSSPFPSPSPSPPPAPPPSPSSSFPSPSPSYRSSPWSSSSRLQDDKSTSCKGMPDIYHTKIPEGFLTFLGIHRRHRLLLPVLRKEEPKRYPPRVQSFPKYFF